MSRRGFGSADHQARYNVGALEQRVYSLEQAIGGISQQIAGISQQITAGVKTNWPVIIGFGGFAMTVITGIGAMAYWPIRETQADLKAAMVDLAKAQVTMSKEYVTIREIDARGIRTQADISRLNTDLNAQETNMRRSIESADVNLQRQIDEMKKAFGDTFNLRDALLQMRRELDDLKRPRSQEAR